MTRAYTANGLNQYTAAGAASFTYDANGNLTGDGSRTYTYDAENRLVASSNGAALAYDPLGRLYQVTLGTSTTRFLYDGDALVEEYNGAGTLLRRHAHWEGADVPVATFDVSGGTGLGTLRYLFTDHQGSIIAEANGSGAITHINTYDEYGIPAATNVGRFQYTGQAWLAELGMYYYKARIYSPTLGRFLQTDPIGYADQFNLYEYVGDDPVNGSDPSGMATDPPDNQNRTCGSRVGISASCTGPTILGLIGSSSPRSQSSHIGMNGLRQAGPPPESPLDGETMATKQDSIDMRDVMAGRMTQQELTERRQGRFDGAMTGAAGVEGGLAVRGGIALTRRVLALRAAGATRADFIRFGTTVIPRSSMRGGGRGAVAGRAISGGGTNRITGVTLPYHLHITAYNWYRPWRWLVYSPIE